jgi:hypothetical protein
MNFNIPASIEAAPQEKKLTPEEIELIETAPLSSWEKVEILLVKAGITPVNEIELYGEAWEKGKDIDRKSADRKHLDEITDLLGKLGMACKIGESELNEFTSAENIDMQRERVAIVYGTKDSLDRLMRAEKTQNHNEMGLCYGYPETAINAYGNDEKSMPRRDLPSEIKAKEFYPFIEFFPSKDNWREEIKTAENRAAVVKRISPKLFEEYSEYAKGIENFY